MFLLDGGGHLVGGVCVARRESLADVGLDRVFGECWFLLHLHLEVVAEGASVLQRGLVGLVLEGAGKGFPVVKQPLRAQVQR